MAAAGSCMAPATQFGQARLIPNQQLKGLELCHALVARIPVKMTQALMCQLGNSLPLNDLKHLKRVRKAEDCQGHMDIIVAGLPVTSELALQHDSQQQPEAASRTDANSAAVPVCWKAITKQPQKPGSTAAPLHMDQPVDLATVANLLSSDVQQLIAQLPLRLVQVPAQPPQIRQQWEEWGSRYWPMAWKVPDPATAPPTGKDLLATAAEQAYFERHLAALLEAMQQAGACNAARIVDPLSNQLVSQGVDCRQQHPLHHAAMVAIHAASERDMKLWPDEQQPEQQVKEAKEPGAIQDKGAAGLEGIQGAAANQQGDIRHGKHMAGGSENGAADSSAEVAHIDKRPRLQARTPCSNSTIDGLNASGTTHQGAAGMRTSNGAAATALPAKPYMCTGYDCFVVMEPCVMCAMALVHSRLSRVIYCVPDLQAGVLGGKSMLMHQRSLNHHYRVYHVPLETHSQ